MQRRNQLSRRQGRKKLRSRQREGHLLINTNFPPLMVLTYQQTIQGAFRDVSNALVAYRKDQEFTAQQHLFESARAAARLSEVRFKAGTTDYLEVLTNETNSLTAELGLAQARGNELIALVQVYQALGGGWQ